jgi:hypothetical protein
MKRIILLSVLAGVMPLSSMAQDDDLYFTPTKGKVVSSYEEAEPAYYSGSDRDVDEYNRNGKFWSHYQQIGSDSLGNDIIQMTMGKGIYPDSMYVDTTFAGKLYQYYSQKEDFDNTEYMRRWVGFYDPWYYRYRYGYGPYWGYGPSWRYGWYSSWYSPWFDSWYDPYYYGWYPGYYYGFYGWYDPWYYGYVGPYYWPHRGIYVSRYSKRQARFTARTGVLPGRSWGGAGRNRGYNSSNNRQVINNNTSTYSSGSYNNRSFGGSNFGGSSFGGGVSRSSGGGYSGGGSSRSGGGGGHLGGGHR